MTLRASILPTLAALCLTTAAVAPTAFAAAKPLTRAEKIQQLKHSSIMSEGQQHIVRGWMAAHPGKKLPKAMRMIPVKKEEDGGRAPAEAGGGLTRAVQRASLESSSTPHLSSFGTNVRVNNPTGDVFPDAGQSETSVAGNGGNLLITWNDGDGFDRVSPNDQLLGFGYSTNGGTTWTDGGQLPQGPGHPLWEWSSDPVLVVNPTNGDFYFAGLVFPDGGSGTTNGVAVVKGTFSAGSFSWGTPTLIQSVNNASAFIDKEWLAIDPANGNLYLSFTKFTLTGDEIDFTRSTNGGTVWSAPVALSAPADNGWVQGSRVVVGPSSEVYVTWMAIGHSTPPAPPIVQDFFRMRKSVTTGSSFAGEVTAVSYYSNFGMGAPGFNRGRGINYPGIAVDRTNGASRGRVYLTWNECVNFYNDLDSYVSTGSISETEPSNTSGQDDNATRARLFTPGNTLRGSIANRDTDLDFYKFSATQGQTYVFWADSTSDNLSMIFRLFCSDSTTRLALSESGMGLGGLIVWTCPVSGQYYIRPAADPDPAATPTVGPHPYRILTMVHTPTGGERARDQRDIFVASSTNGTTWPISGTGAPVRVNEDSPWFDNWLPEVAVTGDSHVFCTWFDFRDSNPAKCGGESNLYLYRSDNAGDNWTNLGLITDATTNWTTVQSNVAPNQGDYIALFANGTNVIPCWGDGRDGNPNVYLVPILASTPTLASLASSRVEAGQVELDWLATEYANQSASLERSESTGGGWSAVAEKVVGDDGHVTFVDASVTAGHTYSYRLAIAGSGGTVYSAETRIAVPAGYSLALGPPQPNPAVRDLWIGFTLPTAEPASLTLVDIAGRVVATREVGSLGAGPHRVNLAGGRQLPAGVYLVKLQQGARTLTTRASVVR